jgi:phospholipase D1/2
VKPEAVARIPSEAGDEAAPSDDQAELPPGDDTPPSKESGAETTQSPPPKSSTFSEKDRDPKSQRQTGAEPFEKWERDEMEKLLSTLNGHLGNVRESLSCERCSISISSISQSIPGG